MLSNSEDVFKIKCETSDITALKEFNLAVYNWGQENGFKVMRKMELFPHIPYGAVNCMTHYVAW